MTDNQNAARQGMELNAVEIPDEIAIVDGEKTLTWREWNRLSNKLASSLKSMGLGFGDRIAVRMRIGWEWYIVNQAIAKIGSRQVALNWKLTAAEGRYTVEDSGAAAVVFDDDLPMTLFNEWKDIPMKGFISISSAVSDPCRTFNDMIEQGEDEDFVSTGPMRIIYYTSGTTGRPKGAFLSDETMASRSTEIMEYMQDLMSYLPKNEKPKVLMSLPLHHAAGPQASDVCIKAKGTLYLMRKFDAEQALQFIDEYKITTWSSVPTMISRIHALGEEIRTKYNMSSIKSLSLGAAVVPFSLKQFIVDYFGPNCLWEKYGMTEAGMATVMAPEDQLRKPGSSGRPYKHVQISIRDETGKELPPNNEGEIFIKTPIIIDEYIGKGPLGEDSLSKDGFFRGGDVGHIDEDGFLFITDRIKDMIVAGGVNIYPAEIEKVIIQHPKIIDVTVIGIPHDDFGEQVMAFCEIDPDNIPTEDEVLDFCKDKLAKYKLPRKFDFVESIPRNPMGKALKVELRRPYWEGRERQV